jgi:hypothetical protein
MGGFVLQKVAKPKNDKQATKKRKIGPSLHITVCFGSHRSYNKSNPTQQIKILKNLVLYVVKGY